MKYSAVLFDLDGTLLNTLEDLADSMNAALARENLAGHPVEAYKRFVGDGVVMLARRVLPTGRRDDDALVQRVVALMRQEYSRRWDVKTRPYDGICELLDDLVRRGVKTAVLSNKPDEFTRLCVSRLLPGRRFDAVVGAGGDILPKPDPTGALRVVATLGIPAGRIIYLGDSNTDMKTALAAGMYPAGALWGFRDAEELLAAGAKTLIEHPQELLGLL